MIRAILATVLVIGAFAAPLVAARFHRAREWRRIEREINREHRDRRLGL